MLHTIACRARRALAVLAAAGTILASAPLSAQGDLLVAPTRVILNGSRGTEVILSNIGAEEATYRISLELRRMLPDGSLVDVTEGNADEKERAALEMIRYAPRRVTLPPGQPQAVRIAARPGGELPDGEYRVHMAFRGIPKPTPAPEASEAKGISVALIPVYGVTIPVIVRQGRLEAQVAIANPRLVQGERGAQLELGLARTGDSSTYGEIRVSKDGKQVFLARGIAVYPEIGSRAVALPLTPEQAAAMRGPVRIEYREMPESGGGLLAATDTVLG